MNNTADSIPTGLTDENIVAIPGLASRWVRLADGRRAHYVTSGDTGPAVVLLYGGIEGSSGTAGWRFMAPFLGAQGFRVYCPDRPGYGLADTSAKQYLLHHPKAQVDFLQMFVDALCLDKFHLGGNSAGCMLSSDYVVSNPERVSSVFFIAGALGDICPTPRIPPSGGKFNPNPQYVMPVWDGSEEGMQELMDGIIFERKAVWPTLVTMRTLAGNAQREARARHGIEYNPFVVTDPNMLQIFSTKGRLEG
jgi:2-hydroxy-6-oxonona-2,4-dienedioate hydrolase